MDKKAKTPKKPKQNKGAGSKTKESAASRRDRRQAASSSCGWPIGHA